MILNRKKNRNNGGENARYKSKLGAEEAANSTRGVHTRGGGDNDGWEGGNWRHALRKG